ncbi:MAG: VWA domain-containing protein [Campylobacteraceae bacterium]|nr:VWA domain-containing protein [Campylobacteraceae bacterium]
MSNFSFEYPYVFFLFIVFIVCAYFCKGKNSLIYIPHLLAMPLHVKKNRLLSFLKWLSIGLLIFSLASPVMKNKEESLHFSHALMLLMDVSESMSRGGLSSSNGAFQSKFTLSKQIASSFVKQRENDNIGVIVFGDFAYVATPLTFDHQSASMIVQNIDKDSAGKKTAMYDALFLAARLLQKNSAKEKVIILLTDGFNTTGKISLDAALRSIESEKIKVYAIGVGRNGEYDEEVLNMIAHQSGGAFFKASSGKMLEEVYSRIDKMEKSLQSSQSKVSVDYLYMYSLILGFFTLLFYMGLTLKEEHI